MPPYRYRITVDSLDDQQDASELPESLQFEFEHNENIFTIVERLRTHENISEDEAATFGVGLKLFGSVLRTHRNDPIGESLWPHFLEFMKTLKQGVRKS
ncbi:MAG: DUF3861 domain-containing protein [Enterobacteriaceae bacterium]|jgi:hypothetical protein|nr:DUF3861 domain-containing protein [Enterobacteriaceae bacterium]